MVDRTRNIVVLCVRWTSRIWSIASIGIVLAFLVGEGFDPATLKVTEGLGFLFFPVGISVGMSLAWWRENIGGIITIGSFVAFYAIHLATAGTLPKGWAWIVFAAPGFLFLLSWYCNDPQSKRGSANNL